MPPRTPTKVDARLARVIKCLRLLEQACYSAEALAARFGVSKRTVYRDLRLLSAAGVPLARRAGQRGYHVAAPASLAPAKSV